MVPLLILCAGMVAATPQDTRQTYQDASAAAGRDADAHVKLALWCEAHDLEPERLKHLALAVLIDPRQAQARGLLGLVAARDRWQPPEAVTEQVEQDEALSRTLSEYQARRARMNDTADDHEALADWCADKGLKAESRAHLTAVTRLDPARASAWRRLGCKRHHGQWLTPEQIAAEIAEAEAQGKADRSWQPRLERWRIWLGDPSRRDEAVSALAAVIDPRAVPSICRAFGKGEASRQALAVRLLGQIEAPASARALALLALSAEVDQTRQRAIETLNRRDPREFVDFLIEMLRAPVAYFVEPVQGPGTSGILKVEGERFHLKRLYSPPPLPKFQLKSNDVVEYDDFGLPVVTRITGYREERIPGTRLRAVLPQELAVPIGRMIVETNLSAQVAQRQLQGDIAELDRYNDRVHTVNTRVASVLNTVTGTNLGADDPDAWRSWWTDRQGYSYQSPATIEKPTVVQNVALRYRPQSQATQFTGAAVGYRRGHSCFAAGTPVRTLTGPRPIESIQIGDQVLTQETTTGVLSFEPVLAVHHNPPGATLRIKLGDETIVATGIHRFWRAGQGWTMARDLKPGDPIRTLGAVLRVTEVSNAEIQPVFNLEVGSHRSFFVGTRGTLVHDNSLVEPVTRPFDASPILAARGPHP